MRSHVSKLSILVYRQLHENGIKKCSDSFIHSFIHSRYPLSWILKKIELLHFLSHRLVSFIFWANKREGFSSNIYFLSGSQVNGVIRIRDFDYVSRDPFRYVHLFLLLKL